MDHNHRNANQTSRNDRAPADMYIHYLYCASFNIHPSYYWGDIPPSSAWFPRMRGNLQILPVPTTEPRHVSSTASEEENVPCTGNDVTGTTHVRT